MKKEGRTAVTAISVLTVKEEEVVNLFLSTLGTAGVLENLDPMVPFALVCEEFAPVASAIDFAWKSDPPEVLPALLDSAKADVTASTATVASQLNIFAGALFAAEGHVDVRGGEPDDGCHGDVDPDDDRRAHPVWRVVDGPGDGGGARRLRRG